MAAHSGPPPGANNREGVPALLGKQMVDETGYGVRTSIAPKRRSAAYRQVSRESEMHRTEP